MKPILRIRNIILVLIGVAGLFLKSWISDSISNLVYCYFGNFVVSFAVYFLIALAFENRLNQFFFVIIALAIVEIFELTDGFGMMSNVYDPYDYIANAFGIIFAFIVDLISIQFFLIIRTRNR